MKTIPPALLSFLLNAIWQIVLVVGLAAICDWLLRGLPARYRHYVWTFTLVICLAPPILSSFSLPKPRVAAGQSESDSRPIVTSRIVTPGVETVDAPVIEGAGSLPRAVAQASSAAIHVNRKVALALVGLYALLLLWRMTSLLRAWRRTRMIVRSAFECDFSEPAQAIISECQAAIGTRASRILCSAEVQVPITVGVIKRIIILPQRFAGTVDNNVLRSAIGHELVHIERRDYLMNLIYEFIFLPISFHPAAAFARRRIRHTRELCCDETVVARLMKPEAYARSLVSLIGSAPPWRQLASDTAIGMNESDILEVRIMSLLRKPNFPSRRRTLLLITASLLLLTPSIAATRYAPRFETYVQERSRELQEKEQANQRELLEKVTDLRRQARVLQDKLRRAREPERAAIESKLREVREHLEAIEETKKNSENDDVRRLRRMLEEYEKSRPADRAKIEELRQQIAMAETTRDYEKVIEEVKAKMEEAQRLNAKDRKARLIYHIEPEYTPDAREKKIEGSVLLGFTIDHEGVPQGIQIKRSLYPSLDQAAINAVQTWRFEPAMKNGEPVSMWVESEVVFRLDQQGWEARARRAKEEFEKAQSEGQEYAFNRRSTEEQLRSEEEAKRRNSELARQAKISMDQAIQIATSKTPGKVLECSLVGEHWEGRGELAKPGLVLYHVVILSGDENAPATYHVLINAVDGSVYRSEKEELKKERVEYQWEGSPIEGGKLNGKAISLPVPEYPAIARAAGAEGAVEVRVLIDENGNVVAAKAVSGHPLLQPLAVSAAREAKFAPTQLAGRREAGMIVYKPAKVAGTILYNFVRQ